MSGVAVRTSVSAATATVGGGGLDGSAVPMGTGIPFALAVLAVLAVLSTHLPSALRAFPPTLAVADDRGPSAHQRYGRRPAGRDTRQSAPHGSC